MSRTSTPFTVASKRVAGRLGSMPRAQMSTGFTLVELVLAVAVIAILSSLAFSLYSGYVKEARINRAIQELRAIELLIVDFGSDRGIFPTSLADVGADQMRDPWGNPYEYLNIANALKSGKGQQRKDKFLVPVNSDFDLYSMGPDGVSQPAFTSANAKDDVVRANNGSYFGLAEDY